MQEVVEKTLGKLLLWSLGLVTLLVTPFWSLDPINPIKMLAISTFGLMSLGVLLANRRELNLMRYKFPFITIIGFALWLIVVFFNSKGEKLQQLFGTSGRNTGLITYLAFSILFVVSMTVSNDTFLRGFFLISLSVGLVSLVYGVLQTLGKDPFDWENPYSPVFGFLGNPNFQSSLLGILGSIVFTQMLLKSMKLQLRVAYAFYLLLTLFVIKETASQQGFLVLLIGSGFAFGIYLGQKNKAVGLSYLGLALIAFVTVLIGILNKGPLAQILYKDSVTYRGDYWRAGWKMTLENPIFGVGLDSYGDWYRRSRTVEATLRRGPETTSNAAHNVFLDISSYGGFPLLLIYATLMLMVLVAAVRVIKRSPDFNAGFIGLVAGWIAFQAQSLISINQIGLAIWGWALSGLIIGYEVRTRNIGISVENRLIKKSSDPTQVSAGTSIMLFVGLTIGVLIGLPPYIASAKYKSALETGDPKTIQLAAYDWPMEPSRMVFIAQTLNENKLEAQALKVAMDAVAKFQDNFGAWQVLYSIENAPSQQKTQALVQMRRLDPMNPTLK